MLLLLLSLLFSLGEIVRTGDPEIHLDVKGIIERWDYPAEVHQVITQDGYILDVFRIPKGQNELVSPHPCVRPAILLIPGLGLDAAHYVLNPPDQSAAFIFADAGFDVFIGSHRGSKYGSKHVRMSTNDNEFWQFSLDELSNYDIPALIDQALELSGNEQLYYVGHSQVRKMFALAPISAASSTKTPFIAIVDPFVRMLRPVMDLYTSMLGAHAVSFDFPAIRQLLAQIFCVPGGINVMCKGGFALIVGPIRNELYNMSRFPVYLAHVPSRTSTWTVIHFMTNGHAQRVMHFDYGSPIKNIEKYGKPSPPPHNFKQIDTELYLFWSRNDYLSTPEDIERILIPSLKKGVIKGSFEIAEYNHADYAIAITAKQRIFDPIIDIIRRDDPRCL